jgi:thioredoxin reductase (NADPH)
MPPLKQPADHGTEDAHRHKSRRCAARPKLRLGPQSESTHQQGYDPVTARPQRDTYDALIIGGGPAGLSAAVYLGRARRSVAVIDCDRPARSDWKQINRNYLGFPDGISIVELCERGRQQAREFGAEICDTEVRSIERHAGGFRVVCTDGLTLQSRGVVIATGVTDRWVTFPGYEQFIGRTMHWCIVCDGCEMQGQRVVVAGNDAEAVEMAVQMKRFAESVSFVTNSDVIDLSAEDVGWLERNDIPVSVGKITGARASAAGVFDAILLDGDRELRLDHLFSAQGCDANSDLARALGVELDENSFIRVDAEAKTNLPGLFAAGDVTRLFAHQVVTAAHEGATAASTLDYYLFQQDQGRDQE